MSQTKKDYAKKIDDFLNSSTKHIGHIQKKEYSGWVFFLDVDNTLLNNDALKKVLKHRLKEVLGEKEARRFWALNKEFRSHENMVDFPSVMRSYCQQNHADSCHTKLYQIFFKIPFKNCVYPSVEKSISYLKQFGPVTLFTEGDAVYQQAKTEQSGLSNLVEKVFLFKSKQDHIFEAIEEYSQLQPVFFDDRLENLVAVSSLSEDAVTIHVCQGAHGKDPHSLGDFIPTITLHSIEEIIEYVFD